MLKNVSVELKQYHVSLFALGFFTDLVVALLGA